MIRALLLTTLTLGLAAADVATWVPPYNLDNARKALALQPGGQPIGSWLTRVGLQFWQPNPQGRLQFVQHRDKITDATVAEFRDAGGEGIEVVCGSHTADQYARFADCARSFGFRASRGSDFHAPGEGSAELGSLPALPDSLEPVWLEWPEAAELA